MELQGFLNHNLEMGPPGLAQVILSHDLLCNDSKDSGAQKAWTESTVGPALRLTKSQD